MKFGFEFEIIKKKSNKNFFTSKRGILFFYLLIRELTIYSIINETLTFSIYTNNVINVANIFKIIT